MTETDIKNNWNYFRSLTKQFQQTEQFVDHYIDSNGNMTNGKTFSNEFAKLLLLSASEFEVIAKTLCNESGKTISDKANILEISKTILTIYPNIINTEIQTPYKVLTPLLQWAINKNNSSNVIGIPWWTDYNKIKHDRLNNFPKANLNNCVNALASLMILELYLSQKVLGNLDIVSSFDSEYFNSKYELCNIVGYVGNKLPDF